MIFRQRLTPAALGWLLFAAFNIWSECIGDVPRLVVGLMRQPRPALAVALINIVIVAGIAQYAVGGDRLVRPPSGALSPR